MVGEQGLLGNDEWQLGDDDEVRIVAKSERTLASEPEVAGDVAGKLGNDFLALAEQQRKGVLDAGDATPHGEDVLALSKIW